MEISRQIILDYIRNKRVVSVLELSRALSMTRANARHHLKILEEQGLVQEVGHRLPSGRGRPAKLYGVTEQLMQHNLHGLSHALLLELLSNLNEEQTLDALEQIATQIIHFYKVHDASIKYGTDRSVTIASRLYRAIQHLNHMHYQSRWEAHAGAPRIILGHCPYYSILPEHPELCQLDAIMLEQLIGVPMDQIVKLAEDDRGLNYCLFALQAK